MEAWDKDELMNEYAGMLGWDIFEEEDDPYFGVWPKDGSNDDIDDFGDFD